jgi:2Fe-2S ferredoxin
MDNLKRGGMDEILGLCGGCASCGTCHVYVADDWFYRLPPIQSDEETILAFSDWREPNSRLSCQIKVTDERALINGVNFSDAPLDSPDAANPTVGTADGLTVLQGVTSRAARSWSSAWCRMTPPQAASGSTSTGWFSKIRSPAT